MDWIYWCFAAFLIILALSKFARKPSRERASDAAHEAVSTLPSSDLLAGPHEGVTTMSAMTSAMTVPQVEGDPPPEPAQVQEPVKSQPVHLKKDYTAFRQALDWYAKKKRTAFSSHEKRELFLVYLGSQQELEQLRQFAANPQPGHAAESDGGE